MLPGMRYIVFSEGAEHAVKIDDTLATSYDDLNAKPGERYHYLVRARYGEASTGFSYNSSF